MFFSVYLKELGTNQIWFQWNGFVSFWLDGADTIKTFCQKFDDRWYTGVITNGTTEENIGFSSIAENYELDKEDYKAYFSYNSSNHKCQLTIGGATGKTTTQNIIPVNDRSGGTHSCTYLIAIQAITQDAVEIIGTGNMTSGVNSVTYNIWSRYQCYVLSSLAEDDVNGFLGHTRDLPYHPIKYYRLKNKNKKFWIELYETRYHDVPVIIPNDKRDDLIIEAIVCFTSNGML